MLTLTYIGLTLETTIKDLNMNYKNKSILLKTTIFVILNTITMKKFIPLFFLFFFNFFFIRGNNQTNFNVLNNIIELQSKKINNLEKNVVDLKLHMNNHHSQFKIGMITSIVGTAITVIDPSLVIFGSALSIVGSIIVWDSDKFFGLKYTNKRFIDKFNSMYKQVLGNVATLANLIKKCQKLLVLY